MTESIRYQARMYLRPPQRSLWKWTLNGDAVQWSSGQTIAFTEELKEILRHQTARGTRGLPPFGAVLLLVAATRDNWNKQGPRDWRTNQFEEVIKLKSERLLEVVTKGLDLVQNLNRENRSSVEAKMNLADVVFATSTRTSALIAQEVLRILDSGVEEIYDGAEFSLRTDIRDALPKDLVALRTGLSELNESQLTLLRHTGLEKFPTTDETIELPGDFSPNQLFAELESDQELYVLGRAARQLYSVLSLPQPSFQESDLQQGGVSDIANRGPLDRLLLSELAHDDLTLAVRIAVNEAMYLRRESPPENSQPRQMVVLDSGLRCWGQPRLLGTAMGMALVAQSDKQDAQQVFSASRDKLEAISLSNRVGITSHLSTLRPELDLTESLSALEHALDESDSDCDVVLVTGASTADSEVFATRLNQTDLLAHPKLSRLFLGSVARGGETKLIEVNRMGRKLIKQLTLDMDQLLLNPPSQKRSNTDESLPAFLGLEKVPLLLSCGSAKPEFVWPIGPERLILLTGDQRLLYFTQKNRGGEQISEQIATAKVWWFSTSGVGGRWSAVVGHEDRRDYRLLAFDQTTKNIFEIPLDISKRPKGFCSHQASLFVIYEDRVALIDQSSGEEGASLSIPRFRWQGGRFFEALDSLSHHALASNGVAPTLELVPLPPGQIDSSVQNTILFETESIEGPIAVPSKPNPEVYLVGQRKTVKLRTDSRRVQFVDSCPHSGKLLLGSIERYSPATLIDVSTGRNEGHFYYKSFRLRQLHSLVGQHGLRHRFRAATIAEDGTLSLASKNQLRLEFQARNESLMLENGLEKRGAKLQARFSDNRGSSKRRYTLKVARWRDGSEAWLDSRGLLHLRSSSRNIPELTITLSHGPCAGWCADGSLFGKKFYTDGTSTKNLTEVIDLLKQFGEHIINSCQ